jgi:hypothetical protein
VLFPCDESFRKSAKKINRVLRRDEKDAVQYRTIDNMIEREGERIQEYMSEKAEEILKNHGFTAEGRPVSSSKEIRSEISDGDVGGVQPSGTIEEQSTEEDPKSTKKNHFDDNKGHDPKIEPFTIQEEVINQAIEEINAVKGEDLQIELSDLHETFEDPAYIKANISLDDVLAKKQKESNRKKNAPSKEKFVKNTVAHLQNGEQATYLLNAACIEKILILVLAFLLENGLHTNGGQLTFFIDGAADLRSGIQSLFLGLWPFKIILDWFHLEKKCKERLSMAMKGKLIRNKVLAHITQLLWYGKVEAAIAYLQDLNKDDIKNQDEIKRLIGYLERNRSFIPCYVLRQKLGLRVSSNQGEKANDLVVSSRQKHNGMSWSASGSNSLASVTTVHLNNEYSHWLLNHDIAFHFKKAEEKVAA